MASQNDSDNSYNKCNNSDSSGSVEFETLQADLAQNLKDLETVVTLLVTALPNLCKSKLTFIHFYISFII